MNSPSAEGRESDRFAWQENDIIMHWPKGTRPPEEAQHYPHTWFDPATGKRTAVNCPPDYVIPSEEVIERRHTIRR